MQQYSECVGSILEKKTSILVNHRVNEWDKDLLSYKEMDTDMIRSIVIAAAIPTFMIGISHEIYVRKEN